VSRDAGCCTPKLRLVRRTWMQERCARWSTGSALSQPMAGKQTLTLVRAAWSVSFRRRDNLNCSRLFTGNYERFCDISLTRAHNLTTGKVYDTVIRRERAGDYLGRCASPWGVL
jgi:hypothetical protein